MKTRPTIGLLTRGWTPDVGGVETHTEGLARALMAAGFAVTVLAGERDPRRSPYAVRDTTVGGVHVRRVALPVPAPASAEDLAFDPRAEARVREWLVNARPDLVHVHHLSGFGLGALEAVDLANLPLVMTLHDYWTLCPRGHMVRPDGGACAVPRAGTCGACIAETWFGPTASAELAGRRTRRAIELLGRVDRLLVPSATVGEVYAAAGIDPQALHPCPPGIEPQALAAETAQVRRLLPAGRRLGVLGAVRPAGGALELARAVIAADLADTTLEVHGALEPDCGDASYVNALRALADREPARLRLHGPYPRRELPAVLATLDGVAAPARWAEPDALAVREARAVGLPVLAARRGALADMDDDPGVTLVEGEDQGSWVRALGRFDFSPCPPPPAHGLLAMTEELLGVYREAWLARRAARVGA